MKLTILVLLFLIISCTNAPNKTTLTLAQQSAFEALNTLQVSSDMQNRLYSTFANIDQPCYPADTSFVITQAQLFIVMKKFVSRHYKNLPAEQQDKLVEISVKAQEEYQVLHCNNNSENEHYENGLPMTGTWIMPNVLGRRDVILVW
jgi:hypothetical protein